MEREDQFIPHVVVSDGLAALEFYKETFGGTDGHNVMAADGKRLMHGEVVLDGHRLFVSDEFEASEGGTLRLPANALMFRQSGMAAAVVGPGDRVTLKPVTIARDLGTTVEIAAGLSPSDAVIANPPDSLVSGERVRLAPMQQASN